jgi:hypothetical protein
MALPDSFPRRMSCAGGAVGPTASPAEAGAVLIAGIAGEVTHMGLFFVPTLVALAGAGLWLWRERP